MFSVGRRFILLCMAPLCWLSGVGGATTAHASTYVANCGIAGYLEVRPDHWSGGCTGGSLNIGKLRWTEYVASGATARGQAQLRMPCGNDPCYKAGTYTAPARVRMSTARTCRSGDAYGERYFSRVRVRVKMGVGNPFGFRAGWKTWRVRIPAGDCSYSP